MTNDQMTKTELPIRAVQGETFSHAGFGRSFFMRISAFFIGPCDSERALRCSTSP